VQQILQGAQMNIDKAIEILQSGLMTQQEQSELATVLQAKREWVGLTDEDIGDVYIAWDNTNGASFADFARLIEAQLRKKNG
jgi:hypothetical protein